MSLVAKLPKRRVGTSQLVIKRLPWLSIVEYTQFAKPHHNTCSQTHSKSNVKSMDDVWFDISWVITCW
jgi:hypothetical protein